LTAAGCRKAILSSGRSERSLDPLQLQALPT
jgi:hypothetical protein